MSDSNLAAIRLSRRSVAVAIFTEVRLEYAQERHLSSVSERAEDSTVDFVRWIVATFGVASAALEQAAEANHARRGVLTQLALQILREEAVSVWQVRKDQLFDAFAIPSLVRRKELRAIAASFWPGFPGKQQSGVIWDAAALGLYVQTERQFLS